MTCGSLLGDDPHMAPSFTDPTRKPFRKGHLSLVTANPDSGRKTGRVKALKAAPVAVRAGAAEPHPELPLDRILLGDSIAQMNALPAESIDCIFADPPYKIGSASCRERVCKDV